MNFCWVTLTVNDLEESLKFYRDLLGLKVCRRFGGPGSEIAMLGDEDKPKVELICSGKKPEGSAAGISVGFETESLEESLELMKKNGFNDIVGPLSPAPGVRFFFVKDPNGFTVQIVEQGGAH